MYELKKIEKNTLLQKCRDRERFNLVLELEQFGPICALNNVGLAHTPYSAVLFCNALSFGGVFTNIMTQRLLLLYIRPRIGCLGIKRILDKT